MTKPPRDIVAGWLAEGVPLVDLNCLPGHAEMMAWVKESNRQDKRESKEMDAFIRSLDPDFYRMLAEPDPDAAMFAAAAEMKLLTPEESRAVRAKRRRKLAAGRRKKPAVRAKREQIKTD